MARGNRYAFDALFAFRLSSTGIAIGQLDPAVIGTVGGRGLTSHAFRCYGPLTITDPAPEYKRYEFRSGDGFEGNAQGGINSLGSGEIQLSQVDPALRALMAGGNVDTTTVSNWRISSSNKINPIPFRMGLLAVARNQSRESATEGADTYINRIYPSVMARMIDNNITHEGGENPQAVTIIFEPSKATKFPTGVAFGTNQGWYLNSEYSYEIETTYPLALTSFIGNGVLDTYTVAYKPKYSTVTTGNVDNWHALNGTPTAPTSISTSTGAVVLASAPANDAISVLMYPTQYEAVA